MARLISQYSIHDERLRGLSEFETALYYAEHFADSKELLKLLQPNYSLSSEERDRVNVFLAKSIEGRATRPLGTTRHKAIFRNDWLGNAARDFDLILFRWKRKCRNKYGRNRTKLTLKSGAIVKVRDEICRRIIERKYPDRNIDQLFELLDRSIKRR